MSPIALLAILSSVISCSSEQGDAATGGAGADGGAAASGGNGNGGTGGAADGGAGAGAAGGSAGDAASGGSSGAPGVPEVRFVGRPDRRQPNEVRLAWSGSGIIFRFSGTQASVRLDDPTEFWTVIVDGQQQPRLATTPGERLYDVASGLTDGEHEVQMFRRTEALFGETRFLGVELGASGQLLPPPPAPTRRLEVIGDSISCGYGNEGPDQFCSFTADTENHYLTYGAVAARSLSAELVTIAWSGKGIIYNYGTDTVDPLPTLYERALPEDPTSLWDFSAWQPDAVVINLGTNDFSTDGDPSETEFRIAYRAFLEQLRQGYPNAWIVCLVPTMLGGADRDLAETYITRAVADVTDAGDSRVLVHALVFNETGLGCDWHPSVATHAAMGEALTQKLKDVLGW